MNITTTLLAGATALGMASAATAVVIILDDFETEFAGQPYATSGAVVQTTDTITVDGNTFDRTASLLVDNNVNGAPAMAQFRTDTGNFILSSDTGVSAVATLEYDLGAILFDAQTGSATGILRLQEEFADRPRTYIFTLNGVAVDTNEQLIDTELGFPKIIELNFDTANLTGNDILGITIDAGVAGRSLGDALDLELSFLNIEIPDVPVSVPAPGVLSLLGLGLLGLGLSRRRHTV
ncbi:PEP-CTERM sorting domain-containing protein [Pacificimonas sp. WHA3]|uniref:PEP-CTERM sorting domain-containing protein n=1 Tax=Pacificimonas pallii TaxID=2827236 RepID=A0ABS6SHX4_9SPHN|nr:PEP-CTERM sorting domain-containing protein [Pacificimonas pallii]MBV7257946.1 PEP-CTERM sorting domain-containing protein [Pacificimonas pallii]